MSTEPSWVSELREVARGVARGGVETLRGARPGVLDAGSANAVSSLVLAAFVAGAAVFRTQLVSTPFGEPRFDIIASVLRTLAFAFCTRALVALSRSARSLWTDRQAGAATLTLGEQGLLLRLNGQQAWTARNEVIDITFDEPLASRTLAARPADVLLVLRPDAGRPRMLRLPPYFAPSAEITVARLKRWLGRAQPASAQPHKPLLDDPELHYHRAAHGQLQPGDVVIPEGHGYLLRAPYTALLGVVFAVDVLRTAGTMRAQIVQPVLLAAGLCLVMIVGWLSWMRRRRATRLGLGMLLANDELLVRGKAGVVAVPWPQVNQVEVSTKPRWSPFVGPYATRLLTVSTQEQQQMMFDQSFLGAPASVVAVLCNHFRATVVGTP